MGTYLKELKAVRSTQLFQELDASNSVVTDVDTDEVVAES